jgi:hypothetical protein
VPLGGLIGGLEQRLARTRKSGAVVAKEAPQRSASLGDTGQMAELFRVVTEMQRCNACAARSRPPAWSARRGRKSKDRGRRTSPRKPPATSAWSAAGVGENCGRDKWPCTGYAPCGSDRRAGRLQHQGSEVSVRRPLPWRCSDEACAAPSRDGEQWVCFVPSARTVRPDIAKG